MKPTITDLQKARLEKQRQKLYRDTDGKVKTQAQMCEEFKPTHKVRSVKKYARRKRNGYYKELVKPKITYYLGREDNRLLKISKLEFDLYYWDLEQREDMG